MFFGIEALIVATTLGVSAQSPEASRLEAAVYRSRLGDEFTVVEGVLEFDPRMVAGGSGCSYVVGVQVTDSVEIPIMRDRWRGVLECGPDAVPNAHRVVVETFRFAIAEGEYSIDVSIEPAGKPERARRVHFDVSSLSDATVASDLILAREIGWVDENDSAPGQWTIRRGELGIAAAPYLVAAEGAALSYYVEVYPDRPEALQGHVDGLIRKGDNREIVAEMGLADVEVTGESRPVAGKVSLAGLPPGEYELQVRLELEDEVVVRSQPFRVARSTEATTPVQVAMLDAGDAEVEAYFRQLTDAELADLFDGIVVWIATDRGRRFYRSLDADGKRRFLARYFSGGAEEATGDWKGESPLEVYLQRARHVRSEYGEKAGEGRHAGWRTDRGRVYLIRGDPDEKRVRQYPRSNSPPYEIWFYKLGGGYVYVFVDETGFGNYELVYSSDPDESSAINWPSRVGPAALEELNTSFGVKPRFSFP